MNTFLDVLLMVWGVSMLVVIFLPIFLGYRRQQRKKKGESDDKA